MWTQLTYFTFLLTAVLVGCGGQQEGTVKYNDCREIIRLTDSDFQRKQELTRFTCTYLRDTGDNIIGGECVAVEASGPTCERAYVYMLPKHRPIPAKTGPCPSAHEVRDGGICVCEPGYVVDPSATQCVPLSENAGKTEPDRIDALAKRLASRLAAEPNSVPSAKQPEQKRLHAGGSQQSTEKKD